MINLAKITEVTKQQKTEWDRLRLRFQGMSEKDGEHDSGKFDG